MAAGCLIVHTTFPLCDEPQEVRLVDVSPSRIVGRGVSFVFMVFHYPTPQHRDELVRGMIEVADHLAGKPGCLEVGPRPRERFFLEQAAAPTQ